MEIVNCGLETDSAARPFGDPGDHLGDSWRLSDTREFIGQVLLERLTRGLGAALQVRVDIDWKISDQHVRHACIMLAGLGDGKRATRKYVKAVTRSYACDRRVWVHCYVHPDSSPGVLNAFNVRGLEPGVRG